MTAESLGNVLTILSLVNLLMQPFDRLVLFTKAELVIQFIISETEILVIDIIDKLLWQNTNNKHELCSDLV